MSDSTTHDGMTRAGLDGLAAKVGVGEPARPADEDGDVSHRPTGRCD